MEKKSVLNQGIINIYSYLLTYPALQPLCGLFYKYLYGTNITTIVFRTVLIGCMFDFVTMKFQLHLIFLFRYSLL